MDEDYDKQRERDLKEYETRKEITIEDAQLKFKESLALKHRLSRLVDQYDGFKSDIAARRHKEFEKLRQRADREFEEEKKKRIKQHQQEKERKQREQEEAERREREEAERAEREAADKAAADEERKRVLEERKAKAEADRAERDAAAQKQMQREAEAEARRLERKQGQSGARPAPFERGRPAPAAMDERQPSSDSGARPPIPGIKAGGWRERLAQKQAQEAAGGTAPAAETPAPAKDASPAPAPTRSGWVPPHLRDGGAPRPSKDIPDRTASPANGPTGRSDSWKPSGMRSEGRQESRDAPKDEAPAPALPKKTGGYVPPHLRNRG